MTSNGWQTDEGSQLNAATASGACTDVPVTEGKKKKKKKKEWATALVLTTEAEISQK